MKAWLKWWWLVYVAGGIGVVHFHPKWQWVLVGINLCVITVLLALTIRAIIRDHRSHKVWLAEHQKKMADLDRRLQELLRQIAALEARTPRYWTKEKM